MSESKELPKGWARARIDELVHIVNGMAFKPSQWSTEGLPIIRIQNLNDPHSSFNYCTQELPDKFKVRTGDLLFAWSGTPGTSFGAHVWRGGNAWLNQHIFILHFDRKYLHPTFLRYAINQNLDSYIRQAHGGAGLAHITKGRFEESVLPLAPLPEQHRIVEKIEELFSDLDAGVSALQRAKANLKRYRASVLKSAVEGRLTEEWRKEHPQAEDGQMLLDRILRERREKWEKDQLLKFKEKGKEPPKNWEGKYEEPTHEVGLYDLPSSWAWASALEICERVENGNTPPPDEMASGSGDVPFIKVYNLTRDGRLDFTVNPTFVSQKTHDERLGRSRVLPNDVLMNIVGPPLGKVSLVPETYPEWNMNQAIVLFRASGVVLTRYLVICLLCDEVLRWITRTAKATAGQFNISVGNSRLLPVPLPPLAEQEQIVLLVEERLSQIDSAEKTIDAELIRSKRLRQSILKQAFEGKLVPQDPMDEPASVLLERIKAGKETEQPKKKAKKARARAK